MYFRFGSHVIDVNMPDRLSLLAAVKARLLAHQGFAVATINLDHIVKLRKSAEFRKAYVAQDMVVADGNPIVWLSHLARHPVKLVPGSDMVIPLARLCAATGRSVALVGTSNEALAASRKRLLAEAPGLEVAICVSPRMGFDPEGAEAEAILNDLEAKGIGLCFLALSAPKQERFAALGRMVAPHVGFASIGAGLDFLAGTQLRAPEWVQKAALEWLWRAMSDPGRMIPRYVACIAVLPGQAIAALRQRHG